MESVEVAVFVKGYLDCALWASTLGDDIGTPMDQDYSRDDFAAETEKTLRIEATEFYNAHETAIIRYCERIGHDADYAGHDFWLTRNGHGAGFWDRGIGELGEHLSDASRAYGECDLYIGDDGKIYAQ